MSQLIIEIEESVLASVADLARMRSSSVEKTVADLLVDAIHKNAIADSLAAAIKLGREIGKSSGGSFLSRDEANGTP